jgi:oligopeptide/dipeptide ABC transporter ATP-binding protein
VPGKIKPGEALGSIPGTVPVMKDGFSGCAFRFRCPQASEVCTQAVPRHEVGPDHLVQCHLPSRQGGGQ